jgi:GTPase
MVFEINECFVVEGVGLVVSGIVRSGVAAVNDFCRLGPDKFKNFKNVQIKSIHVSRSPCEQAIAGELACLNVKTVKNNEKIVRKDIRKGMVLVSQESKPEPVTQF